MKLKGRLLLFDDVNSRHGTFTSESILDIPERLPLLWNSYSYTVIGHAEVTRDNNGLIVEAETFDDVVGAAINDSMKNGRIGVGGYYTKVRGAKVDDRWLANSAYLVGVLICNDPINEEYYVEEIN